METRRCELGGFCLLSGKKCWEEEVGVLREPSLFAAGVCRQVGRVCRFDLLQLHLREVQRVI